MNFICKIRLNLAVLIIMIGLCFASNTVHAAARAPHTELEEWIRAPAHNRYGSMGLMDLHRFEGAVERLGPTHRDFYRGLTTGLCRNNEFIDSAYLNAPDVPIKGELFRSIIDHSVDMAINGLGIYLFRQQSTATDDCNTCFAAQNISMATTDCGACYTDTTGTSLTNAGVAVLGIGLAKSALYLINDLRGACSLRGKARFEPAATQTEREAQKIALYLTLQKHGEISASIDRPALRGDYENWAVRILRDYYPRDGKSSLVNSIAEHLVELPPHA